MGGVLPCAFEDRLRTLEMVGDQMMESEHLWPQLQQQLTHAVEDIGISKEQARAKLAAPVAATTEPELAGRPVVVMTGREKEKLRRKLKRQRKRQAQAQGLRFSAEGKGGALAANIVGETNDVTWGTPLPQWSQQWIN